MLLSSENILKNVFVLAYIWMSLDLENGQLVETAFVESCLKDSAFNTSLCNNEKGDLKARFCPRIQSISQTDSRSLKEITCTANKRAKTTIIFNGESLMNFKGPATVVDNGCNKTVKFSKTSLCLNGTYKCVVEDGSDVTVTKQAHVRIVTSDWDFNFNIDNIHLKQSQMMILGTSVNLSCSVSGADWRDSSRLDYPPSFYFEYLDSRGNITTIRESEQIPKKYWYSRLQFNQNHSPPQFIRMLQISNITRNDSGIYACRIISKHGGCAVRRNITINTRPCKAGHYCLSNSSHEQPCPAGTYNNKTGALHQSSCLACPRKYFCLERSSFPVKCPTANSVGRYSFPSSAKSEKDCYICLTGTSCDRYETEKTGSWAWISGLVVGILLLAGVGMFWFLKNKLAKARRKPSSNSSDKNILESMCTDHITEKFFSDPLRQVQSVPKQKDDCEHIYDVFICYSSQDKEWVRKTLLQTLLEQNLRVCIDYRDFAPGAHIIKNIADAIYQSRKTLAVLSPDYITSAWCNEELQMALRRIEDEHQVIPVLFRQCEIPEFLRHRTYLDWCNQDIRPFFWDQLLKAINDGKDCQSKNDGVHAISIADHDDQLHNAIQT